ncbi:MAG: hypothetical protein K2L00_02955, partial [Muribaculaceae bacterium]|nr:hypothetical protein [Muribaculaceae bacterium]
KSVLGAFSLPYLARFRFRTWRVFASVLGAFSLPYLARFYFRNWRVLHCPTKSRLLCLKKNRVSLDILFCREPNLCFYREQSGPEIDAILIEGGALYLYEIKACKTLRPVFLENVKILKGSMPDIKSSTVIYDGESFPPTTVNIRDI